MKKVVIALVVLGVIGGGVAWAVTRTPERRLCIRMGDLCGVEGDLSDFDTCVQELEKLEKLVGEEPVESAAECVDKADSCVEATGCVVGAGVKAGPKLMQEFLEGFQNAK